MNNEMLWVRLEKLWTISKTLEECWIQICGCLQHLWILEESLNKRADNHAVTERSDVKSLRLRLPSESWAEENLLPWELFYWRRPNTALERRQRNTSVQLSGCTKMHQVSYQVSPSDDMGFRQVGAGGNVSASDSESVCQLCHALHRAAGKAKQLRWQPFGMQVSSCWRNGFKSPHYISLHLLRLLCFSHLFTWFAFSHGSLVISLAIQCTVPRCQELLEAGADATLLRVNPETWRLAHHLPFKHRTGTDVVPLGWRDLQM